MTQTLSLRFTRSKPRHVVHAHVHVHIVVVDYIHSVYHPSNGLDHVRGEAWCPFDPDSPSMGAACKAGSLPPAAFGGTCAVPKKEKKNTSVGCKGSNRKYQSK